jgi:hypothetical protein
MLYAPRIDPAPPKLFAIEGGAFRGQSQRSLEACALHLFDRPLRSHIKKSHGVLRLHM